MNGNTIARVLGGASLAGFRRVIVLLTFLLSASAQFTPIELTPRWPALREYLSLSDTQIAAIDKASIPYWQATAPLEKRREALREEIVTATRRSPLLPDELGRLHVEWETIRRQLLSQEQSRNNSARAALTEAQLLKLRALEEAAARRDVRSSATGIGLSPTDCHEQLDPICEGLYIPFVTCIPDWGPRDEDYGPDSIAAYPRLAKYLGLTTGQYEQILEQRQQRYSGREIDRMRAVAAEIRQETTRETLDPAGLGQRYAEVEALRRKISEDQRRIEADSVAALTPAQRLKLEALQEALRLHEELEQARSAGFIGTRCKEQGYVFFDGGRPFDFALFFTYLGDCPDKRALNEQP